MKNTVYCFCILALLVSSCRKKCTEEQMAVIPLDINMEKYFHVFTKDSYWIYENQNRTLKDSLYVTFSERKYMEYTVPCQKLEIMDIHLKESIHKVFVDDDSACLHLEDFILNNNGDYGSLFSSNFPYTSFEGDTITSDVLIKHETFVLLNNQVFAGDIIGIYDDDTLYMQKDIGIIGCKKQNNTYVLTKKYIML